MLKRINAVFKARNREFLRDRGTLAKLFAEPVHYRILAALGTELGIANLAIFTGKIYGKALLGPAQCCPVHCEQLLVERIAVCRLQPGDRH